MVDMKSSHSLYSQRDFEVLIGCIANNFININISEIDNEIVAVQKKICKCLGFQRSVLWLFEEVNSKKVLISYSHATPDNNLFDSSVSITDKIPYIVNQIRKDKSLEIFRLSELPSSAKTDINTLEEMGVSSLIISPLRSKEGVIGGLIFCRVDDVNSWDGSISRCIENLTQILSNALCLKYKEEQNRKLYQFEKLISDISTRFINLPARLLDDQIARVQKEICEALDIELSALWQWSDTSPHYLALTHLHSPPYGPEKPEGIQGEKAFPWMFERLMKGEVLTSDTMDLPVEASVDKATFDSLGVASYVALPLCAGKDKIIGIISFNSVRHKKIWTEALVDRLALVSQIFTNALARQRQELQLQNSEKRLSMAISSGNIGLWEMDIFSRQIWGNSKLKELLQFEPDTLLNYDSFMSRIVKEDQQAVNQAVQDAIDRAGSFDVDYRTLWADGSTRWFRACGKVCFDFSKMPTHLMGSTIDITKQKNMEQQLTSQIEEIKALKNKVEEENIYLKRKINVQYLNDEIIASSKKMQHVLSQAEQVAPTDATVLIQGETGTGKELVAKAIHLLSKRKNNTLVALNCASLPPALVESELFGREKGAYTGALTKMTGRFEIADNATLFLDEVGELPMEIQAKLLRVLEQGQFERLGSTKTIKVNVRIIAATNQNLEKMVNEGKFRKDLFFRLNIFPIHIPPLRERQEDIPPLTWSFVREFENKMAKRIDSIPSQSMKELQHYNWPGNIRELRNLIERSLITCTSRTLNISPQKKDDNSHGTEQTLESIERKHILSILESTDWRISGQGSAADLLGLKRTTLQARMKKLGISRP